MNEFSDATLVKFMNVSRIRHASKQDVGSFLGNGRPFYLVVFPLDHKNRREPNVNLQALTTFRSKKP